MKFAIFIRLFKFFGLYWKLFYLQNNCIGERNTRYFMAFLLWWVLYVVDLFVIDRVYKRNFIELLTKSTQTHKSSRETFLPSLKPRLSSWKTIICPTQKKKQNTHKKKHFTLVFCMIQNLAHILTQVSNHNS